MRQLEDRLFLMTDYGSRLGPCILADRIFIVLGPLILSAKTVYFQILRTVYFRRPCIFSIETGFFQPGLYILIMALFEELTEMILSMITL